MSRADGADPKRPGEAPARMWRPLLWGALVAALLAVGVTAVMEPRWAREARRQPPPDLGAVPDFLLTNRDGSTVELADLGGEPWVADFIFTRCALSCPRLTTRMRGLAPRGAARPPRRVSFSVDPDHDTPEVLQAYAAGFGIEDERWLFLTGAREDLTRLVVEGFKLALEAAPAEADPREPILHSTRFVLVDGGGRIRGYYDALDPADFERLAFDLKAVSAGR